MPPKWFHATCTKEIYWMGKTHRPGDSVKIIEDDVRILVAAGVVGDIKKINETEFAVREAPENAMRQHNKKAKP